MRLLLNLIYWFKTGFSQGTPSIENDDQLAEQVMGFLEQFLEVFSELKGKDFFVSGESVSSSLTSHVATLDSGTYSMLAFVSIQALYGFFQPLLRTVRRPVYCELDLRTPWP